MLYVSGEILVWMALAFLLGLLVGWFIWGWRSRQKASQASDRARAADTAIGDDADQATARVPARVAADITAHAAPGPDATPPAEAGGATFASVAALDAEVPGAIVDVPDVAVPDVAVPAVDVPAVAVPGVDGPGGTGVAAGGAAGGAAFTGGAAAGTPAVDLAAGEAALGRRLATDDLKLVEGIGPAIDELLHAGGVRTWEDLSQASPAKLRSILDAGGARFRMHDPATWPEQAQYALRNEWSQLSALQDNLRAGRR